MAKQQKLNINFAELTDLDLYGFRDRLLTERAKIEEEWADELASFADDTFDQYSFWGARKLKKLGKKYAKKTVGLNYIYELTMKEIAKRDKYKEEQRYSGNGAVYYTGSESDEEFLEKEDLITKTYKSRLDN